MILVTGGAGYIGSHTVKHLMQAGYEVVILDNLSQGHREAVLSPHFVQADLSDQAQVQAVFKQYPIQAVVHFAASALVGESNTDPRKYFNNNTKNTLQLLDTMLDAGVKSFVFSSTCSVYGDPVYTPIDEEHPLGPINGYAESKLMSERILAWYESAYNLRSVRLRYFNACGADADGKLGESHDPETHLIPLTLQVAKGERECLNIYGTDYPTPDGTCLRDYIHVDDLADAHVKALQYLENQANSGTVLNVGTGRGYSVQEVVAACRKITGHAIPAKITERRPGDPSELVAKADKIRTVLGWEPKHSGLDNIIQTAWQWEQNRRF